jgi:spore germination protein KA
MEWIMKTNKSWTKGDFMNETYNIEGTMKNIQSTIAGLNIRRVQNNGMLFYIAYLPEITNSAKISEEIIRPLMQYTKPISNTRELVESVIYTDNVKIQGNLSDITNYVLSGYCIIGAAKSNIYIAAYISKIEKRSVGDPQVQYALRAPRDSFTENLDTNLSLIRYRIKDSNLKLDNFVVGERTRTPVIVAYISNLVDTNVLKIIEDTIKSISIDGILESGYLQKILEGKGRRIFPIIAICERSDKACAHILKGRICIFVEGTYYALMLPQTFIDFLDSGDDHYGNSLLSVFNTLLRAIAIMVTFTFPALYIVSTSYNPDILPANYLLAIAAARSAVPLSAIIEVLFMTAVTEVLKEASIRLPTKIGSAIGIVGGIVIGQATITAGLASPIAVVVVAFSTISSFLIPDYTIVNPLSVLKVLLILITGFLGFFGFVIGTSFIVINIVSQSSFGTPYAKPLAPFSLKGIKDEFFPTLRFYKKEEDE